MTVVKPPEVPDDIGAAAGLASSVQRRFSADLLIVLGIVVIALALRAPLLRWHIYTGDEGYLVSAVERVLDGQVPYRDFQRDYAPGMYYVFAALFSLFGHDLMLTRVVWMLLFCCVCAGAYFVARALAPRWAAVWAGLLPIFLMPALHKMIVQVSIVAGLALCLPLARAVPGRTAAFMTGLAIGVMAFFRQDIAGYTFVIASLSLVAAAALEGSSQRGATRRAAVAWLWMCAGTLTFWTPILIAFAAAGALTQMITQMLFDGLRDNAGMSMPMPPLLAILTSPYLEDRLLTGIYYFPTAAAALGVCAVATAAIRRRLSARHVILAQWVLMALFVHLVYIVRADVGHIMQGLLAPSLILTWALGAAWTRGYRGPAGWGRHAAAVAIIPLILWTYALFYYGAAEDLKPAWKGMRAGVALDEPKARIILPPWKRDEMKRLLAIIRENTSEGDPIFVAPCEPMYYFLTERRNPTRYDSAFPGIVSSRAAQAEIIHDLEKARVRMVLLDDCDLEGYKERRFRRYMSDVADFLAREFPVALRSGGWDVLLRADDAPLPDPATNAPAATSARTQTGSLPPTEGTRLQSR